MTRSGIEYPRPIVLTSKQLHKKGLERYDEVNGWLKVIPASEINHKLGDMYAMAPEGWYWKFRSVRCYAEWWELTEIPSPVLPIRLTSNDLKKRRLTSHHSVNGLTTVLPADETDFSHFGKNTFAMAPKGYYWKHLDNGFDEWYSLTEIPKQR